MRSAHDFKSFVFHGDSLQPMAKGGRRAIEI